MPTPFRTVAAVLIAFVTVASGATALPLVSTHANALATSAREIDTAHPGHALTPVPVLAPVPSADSPGESLGVLAEVPVGYSPTAAIVDGLNGYVYVLDSGGNHAHILSNLTVTARVGTGIYPATGVYDPADGDVYIVDADSYNVTIYHGSDVVGNLSTGQFPYSAAYDAADQEVYVTNYGGYNVTILNGTTYDTGVTVAGGFNDPLVLAYDPADGDIYVIDEDANASVVVLHGTTIEANLSLPGNSNPAGIGYDPADGDMYVTNTGVGNETVLNGTAVVGNVTVGGSPTGAIYDPAVGAMLVLNNGASNSSQNGSGSGKVQVINGTTEVGEYSLPFDPMGGRYDAAASAAIVFGGYQTSEVLAVNGTGVVETIPVNPGVASVAYDPENRLAYLPNFETDNVTVVGEGQFYPVTFSESGLPTGSQWGVTVAGIPASASTPTLTVPLLNGTYNYTVNSTVRAPTGGNDSSNNSSGGSWIVGNVTVHGFPASGQVTVDGAAVLEPTFAMELTVTVIFSESGLPPGLSWSVTLNGTVLSGDSTSKTFVLPSGSYSYSVGEISGYRETSVPTTGTLLLSWTNGSTRYLTLAFSQVTYEVELTEHGLPEGSSFAAYVDGEFRFTSAGAGGAELTWAGLANGTYPYILGAVAGWRQSTIPGTSSLTVAGGTQPTDGTGIGYSATLTYTPVLYNVTFSTLGLPSAQIWKLTVDGTTYTQVAGALTVALPNGTYNYSLADVAGWHQSTLPYRGNVTVDGLNVSEEPFYFTQVTYTVTFGQRGLPAGTNWSVLFGRELLNSTTPAISFVVPNTTALAYVIGIVPGYSPMLTSGRLTVNGSSLIVIVTFSANPSSSSVPSWVLPAGLGAAVGVLVGVGIGLSIRPRGKPPAPLEPSPTVPAEGDGPSVDGK